MRSPTPKTVPVKSLYDNEIETRIGPVINQIRQRAYELYCIRGGTRGSALGDWLLAERERAVAPLASIFEDDNDVRITACVPAAEASDLAVDALPGEIVVEADHEGRVERFSRFRTPARIDANRVKARLCGSRLEVIAPKADKARG
jgi:HSP20 family molecular chaperone IbpA